MSEILQANIFFFITAVAVVVIGVGSAIALYHLNIILRDVRTMVAKMREASDVLEEDFNDLRATIKDEGIRVKTIFELILRFIARQIPKSASKKKTKEVPPEEE